MPKKTVQESTKEPDSSGKPINDDQPDGHTVPVGGDPLNPTYEEDPMAAAAIEALDGRDEPPQDGQEEEEKEEELSEKKKEEPKKEEEPSGKKEEPLEKKEEEPSKLTKDQEDAINFRDNFYKSKEYRQRIAKLMAEQGEIKLADDKAPTKPDKTESDLELDALEPDVRRLVEKVADKVAESKYGSKFKEIDEFIANTKKQHQETAVNNARKEFEEFKAENKELIAKHEKELSSMGRQYPDLLKNKKGLQSLLKLVAHDDIVEQKVREAVDKALKRTDKIKDGVTKFSHSKGTSTNMQDDFSVKPGASFEECAEAAWRQHHQGI